MIRTRGLTRRFGTQTILDEIDLDVGPGERVAVLGLNGSGKTTLFRCLLGVISFDGRVEVDGADVLARPKRARTGIGYVPQRAPHFDGTLAEMIAFFSRLRGLDPASAADRLDALGLPLAVHGDKPTRALSGGMLQKSLLALALAAEVSVLLLDEPTANLDVRARSDFLHALEHIGPDTSILLASHRLGDVEAVADRLLVLHEGRFVFDGARGELSRAAAADATLWLRIPEDDRAEAHRRLDDDPRVSEVRRNGVGLGVRVEPGRRTEMLLALTRAGVAVTDFWTEAAPLEHVLEQLLDVRSPRPAPSPAGNEEDGS